jgi:hypothetical protein
MIIDAGSGLVDFSTYKIESSSPIKIKGITIPTGSSLPLYLYQIYMNQS